VVDAGATVLEAVLPLGMVCTTLSDQVTVKGAVPVRAAVMATPAEPAQNVPPPLTVAIGSACRVAVALPLDVPVQPASLIDITV